MVAWSLGAEVADQQAQRTAHIEAINIDRPASASRPAGPGGVREAWRWLCPRAVGAVDSGCGAAHQNREGRGVRTLASQMVLEATSVLAIWLFPKPRELPLSPGGRQGRKEDGGASQALTRGAAAYLYLPATGTAYGMAGLGDHMLIADTGLELSDSPTAHVLHVKAS